MLVEFDVRIVGVERSENGGRLGDRNGKVRAHARRRTAGRGGRDLAQAVDADAWPRQRRLCERGQRHDSGARRVVRIRLRRIVRPNVHRAGRSLVTHELHPPSAAVRAMDDVQRNRHRHRVAVGGRNAARLPRGCKGDVLARRFVVHAVGIGFELVLEPAGAGRPQVDPHRVVAIRDAAVDVAPARHGVVALLDRDHRLALGGFEPHVQELAVGRQPHRRGFGRRAGVSYVPGERDRLGLTPGAWQGGRIQGRSDLGSGDGHGQHVEGAPCWHTAGRRRPNEATNSLVTSTSPPMFRPSGARTATFAPGGTARWGRRPPAMQAASVSIVVASTYS